MAREVHKLDTPTVKSRIAAGSDGRWGDGGGLYLQIRKGCAGWVFRDYVDGRERWLGLGSARFVSLADARRGALRNRMLKYEGQDPRAERVRRRVAADRQAVTFAHVVEAYTAAKAEGFKDGGLKWRAPLVKHALPALGKLPIALIDTPEVLRVLQPIWGTAVAEHVRQRLSAVFDYATAQKHRSGDNPARWANHLKFLLAARPASEHHEAMPIDDLPGFMRDLCELGGTNAAALKFVILTACRSNEVTGATWSEIDLGAKVWTVPAERMKGKREHRVPLSGRAIEILKAMGPKASGLIFRSGRNGSELHKNTLGTMIKKSLGRRDVTVHGFRSTFRDWAAERTNHPRELAEKALAHTIGNKTETAYLRTALLEKRRRLMEEWGKFCSGPGGKVSGKVVKLVA
jgi:integrase